MSSTAKRSLAAFAGIAIGTAGALALAQSASGQQQNRTSPPPAQPAPQAAPPPGNANIKILKVGIAQPRKPQLPQPPGNAPADLSPADFAAAAKVIFGDTPPEKLINTTLTIRHGYVSGQASMAFANLAWLDYNNDSGGDFSLRVDLAAKANRSYMLDLAFSPYFSSPCKFTITLPDNTKQTMSCPASGHLIVGFQSAVSATQSLLFVNDSWIFHKIAISTLDEAQSGEKKAPLPPNVTAPARAASSAINVADIKIFRSGNPGATHPPPQPPGVSSAELDPAGFAAAAAAVFGNIPPAGLKKVALTARHGDELGHAFLILYYPQLVDYGTNTISFGGTSGTQLAVVPTVVADQVYMADVAYEVANPPDLAKCSFHIDTGGATQDMPCSKPGLQHLLVGLYATYSGSTGLAFNANVPWKLHQVTITRK